MQTGTDRMTRRQLGKLAAAGSAAFLPAARATAQNNAQNSAQNKYGGPLEGLEDKVDAASFDPVLYTRKLYESAPLPRAKPQTSGSVAETPARQTHGTRGRISRAARRTANPDPGGARFPRLPPRKDCLRKPAGTVCARLPADAARFRAAACRRDLRTRSRARRG